MTHKVPASLVERAGGGDGCEDTFGVIGVLGRVPGPGHGSCQPSEGDRTTLYEVVHCARSTTRTEKRHMHAKQSRHAVACTECRDLSGIRVGLAKSRDEKRTARARVVVGDRHLQGEVVKRGDDDDDAGRCRSDARPRPRTAFAAEERG